MYIYVKYFVLKVNKSSVGGWVDEQCKNKIYSDLHQNHESSSLVFKYLQFKVYKSSVGGWVDEHCQNKNIRLGTKMRTFQCKVHKTT